MSSSRCTFDYAIIRVVPRVEREEFINVGAIVFCATRQFLDARVDADERRLAVLAPGVDVAEVQRHLKSIVDICAGAEATGPLVQWSLSKRFHWLVAPSSSVIQTSPVHSGLCADPAVALNRLLETMVRLPR